MSDVIEFAKFKRKGEEPKEWLADLSLFQTKGEYSAVINAAADIGVGEAEMLRKIADCLDVVSFMARQEAERYEASEKGPALAVFTVFADGKVQSRLHEEKITDPEHFHWVSDCLDLMSLHVREGKA